MILPVILSGGSGSRLWPVSREHYPKQFLNLNRDDASLLQETALRAQRLESLEQALEAPLIVCNEAHRFLVAEQMQKLGFEQSRIVLEPCGRNTAPALALAALLASEQDPDAVLLVMPADHVIQDTHAFAEAVEKGLALSREGQLVTFGITPTSAHTGYGYIKRGQALTNGYAVDAFVEKPEEEVARQYLASGDYLWNSGIFLFEAAHFLQALEQHAPDILDSCRAAFQTRTQDMDFIRIDEAAFGACRNESIDYAVMEHTRDAAVVPMSPGWSDIGAWDALHALREGDDPHHQNAVRGDVLLHDTRNSLVYSESRLVATLGVSDLVIVETDDAVLVAHREYAQDTQQIVSALKEAGRPECQLHRTVYRPWGHYRSMEATDGFQVKEIVVNPGAALSLQMHHHRAEHWVVVEGTAKVTQGEAPGIDAALRSFLLSEDQSTYIPLGTVHRLENPGVIPLKLIEVQTGSYLGEDDILRFDDKYGRDDSF